MKNNEIKLDKLGGAPREIGSTKTTMAVDAFDKTRYVIGVDDYNTKEEEYTG